MELITKDASVRFYNQLIKLNDVSDNMKTKQIINIGSLFENVFRTATKNDLTYNTKFFDRMQHVFNKNNIRKDIIDMSHNTRILTNNIRHNGLEPNIKDYELAIQSVAEVISLFSGTNIPIEVQSIYDSSITLPEKSKVSHRESESDLTISDLDLINNPTPRLAVCLALDTSSSMRSNNKINELNKGVKMFFNSILNDELAKYSVELCVVSFGKEIVKLLDFESIEKQAVKLDTFSLEADGLTPMGKGVEMGLKLLEERKRKYQDVGVEYYQPWMVLMTDGQPTDDISNATIKTNNLINSNKLSLFSIAIGDGANIRTLSMFSESRPPLKLKGLNFVEFFEWLSQSTKNTSQSTPGDRVNLPPISGWAEL